MEPTLKSSLQLTAAFRSCKSIAEWISKIGGKLPKMIFTSVGSKRGPPTWLGSSNGFLNT
jgi:hypothetical protein